MITLTVSGSSDAAASGLGTNTTAEDTATASGSSDTAATDFVTICVITSAKSHSLLPYKIL